MKSFETTLSELKKLHARYAAKVESLAAQSLRIASRLQDAQQHLVRAEEAIAALEGRTTEIKQVLQDALSNIPKIPDAPDTQHAVVKIPQNGNLPAPEPGMQWVKNDLNEDVLVPINPPKPLTVPGVVEVAAGTEFIMPSDDTWDSPESFL